jgi:glucose/mannose transport system substrate-binding protein
MRIGSLTAIGALATALPALALASAAPACSSAAPSSTTSADAGRTTPDGAIEGAASSDGGSAVEIFSWWVAPGEAEALQALMDLNKQNHPTVSILNTAAINHDHARELLAQRIDAGQPPDLFQVNAGDMVAYLAAHPNGLTALDGLFANLGLGSHVIPEALQNITVGGSVYAMPVNVHRSHTLYLNKQIFAANHLDPATALDTVDHFLATCQTLKAAGVTPLATAYQGWIQRMMFNEIAIGVMGPQAFLDYFANRTRPDADSGIPAPATLSDAVDKYDQALTAYAYQPAPLADGGPNTTFGWTDAADLLHGGNAAMYMHGNWVTGYMIQLGWTPGVDFDAVTSPGSQGLFAYDLDTFAMPVGAPNPTDTPGFLTTIASPEGQVRFAKLKGSSPMRLDIPLDMFGTDTVSKSAYDDLVKASIRHLMPSLDAWDNAFGQFPFDHDKAALLKAFADNPPLH